MNTAGVSAVIWYQSDVRVLRTMSNGGAVRAASGTPPREHGRSETPPDTMPVSFCSSEGHAGVTMPATNTGNTLLLTAEEWEARRRQREQGQGSGSDNKPGKKGKPKNQQRGNNGRGANGERDMSQVKCYNGNQMGHFSKSCTEPRKERKGQAGQAHLARAEEEAPALLMAQVCTLTVATTEAAITKHVLLNDDRSSAGVSLAMF